MVTSTVANANEDHCEDIANSCMLCSWHLHISLSREQFFLSKNEDGAFYA